MTPQRYAAAAVVSQVDRGAGLNPVDIAHITMLPLADPPVTVKAAYGAGDETPQVGTPMTITVGPADAA